MLRQRADLLSYNGLAVFFYHKGPYVRDYHFNSMFTVLFPEVHPGFSNSHYHRVIFFLQLLLDETHAPSAKMIYENQEEGQKKKKSYHFLINFQAQHG